MDERQLRDIPLFSSLSRRELQEVASHADEVEVGDGRQLMGQGELAYELFVIEEGFAQVFHDGKWIAELGPGDFAGEMGTLARAPRSASVIATTPMRLIVMTDRAFREINQRMPALAEQIRAMVEERNRALAG
jgi:CRP-like cAMP-binding protein